MSDMKFSEQTHFTGRNGFFKSDGLSIEKWYGGITLIPITSKNKKANCSITIPLDDIPHLIKQLKEITNG